MSRYARFDRSSIQLEPLHRRGHDLLPGACLTLDAPLAPYEHPEFDALVAAIRQARRQARPVILMMGAHPIKLGLSRFLVQLIEDGLVTCVATNGAGIIHDFELAMGVGTSENVARWIRRGQFGLWRETGRLNEIVSEAARRDEGIGEAVGRVVEQERFACRELSIAAAGWRCGVPLTAHVGIGCDIVHSHPNCDGGAWGRCSYHDFLVFTAAVAQLEGGVFLNVGSAVTGPEIYLKALSMVRNAARRRGEEIGHFTTAVFDLVELPPNFREGPPGKDHPQYYYRPWKTILVRTVADGGQSFYFQGDHRATIPSLYRRLSPCRPAAPARPADAAGLPAVQSPRETEVPRRQPTAAGRPAGPGRS